MGILLLVGCNEHTNTPLAPDGSVYSENFVQLYLINDRISLSSQLDRYITIEFKGKLISNRVEADREEYKRVSDQFGDNYYNGTLLANCNYAIANKIEGISIVCNSEFDSTHGIGESLGDLVKICAVTCYDYIQNGYKLANSESYPGAFKNLILNNGNGYQPVFKFLDAFKAEDSMLSDTVCYLYFTEMPEKSGEYVFQVSVRSAGIVQTEEITLSF